MTCLRKSGKSYLLGVIFKQHLIENGVKEEQIIDVELDDEKNDSSLEKGTHIVHIKSGAFCPVFCKRGFIERRSR